MRIALRTQQVIAHETGVDEHDRPARRLLLRRGADRRARGAGATSTSRKIDELGGMVEAVKRQLPAARDRRRRPSSYQQRDRRAASASSSASTATSVEDDDAAADPAHRPRARAQADRPRRRRSARARDGADVERALAALREARRATDDNLMPLLLDAARVHATEGEIVEALQDVWGDYTESPVF